ncbi:hypothetical protein DFH09DRAFT_1502591 [Mycena vulgaris]|nr:hypothetical protein DFH09DRAFT_1502591 [Mycena vulgaris]
MTASGTPIPATAAITAGDRGGSGTLPCAVRNASEFILTLCPTGGSAKHQCRRVHLLDLASERLLDLVRRTCRSLSVAFARSAPRASFPRICVQGQTRLQDGRRHGPLLSTSHLIRPSSLSPTPTSPRLQVLLPLRIRLTPRRGPRLGATFTVSAPPKPGAYDSKDVACGRMNGCGKRRVFLLIVVHTLTNGLFPLSLRSCLTDPSLLSCIALPVVVRVPVPLLRFVDSPDADHTTILSRYLHIPLLALATHVYRYPDALHLPRRYLDPPLPPSPAFFPSDFLHHYPAFLVLLYTSTRYSATYHDRLLHLPLLLALLLSSLFPRAISLPTAPSSVLTHTDTAVTLASRAPKTTTDVESDEGDDAQGDMRLDGTFVLYLVLFLGAKRVEPCASDADVHPRHISLVPSAIHPHLHCSLLSFRVKATLRASLR